MNLNNHNDYMFPPRDIRRYPTELDRVPSRGVAKTATAARSQTFSEVATGVNAPNRITTPSVESRTGKNGKPFALWEKDGFGFADFIDIINPLQHIPIVATIYRNFSGDQIGVAPRVIGGALWGRIGGLVTGVANALVEWWSGKDIGDHIYAAIFSPGNRDTNAAAVAQKKLTSSGVVAGANPVTPKPPGDSPFVTATEPLPAPRESDAVDSHALRSDILPMSRVARNSYEKNRKWDEPHESLGIRLPA